MENGNSDWHGLMIICHKIILLDHDDRDDVSTELGVTFVYMESGLSCRIHQFYLRFDHFEIIEYIPLIFCISNLLPEDYF